jgi:HEPN domain-containing protein
VRGAQIDLAAVPPLLEDAVFHCQQVAEKSFKAFLTFHNQPFRKTHNLEELGEACLTIDPTLQLVVDEAVPLSEYAWAYRYPGPAIPLSQAEAEAASRRCGKVQRLSSLTPPLLTR